MSDPILAPTTPDLSPSSPDSPSTPKTSPSSSPKGTPPTPFLSPLPERPAKISRQMTSFVFNESTHTFSVILPDKPTWEVAIQDHFPGSIREETYVKQTYKALNDLGFYNYNTLSCVSLCRDEMCSPFLEEIDTLWKSPFMNIKDDVGKAETLYTHSFCLSSLAGMLFLGVTGMKAAVSHAPIDDNGRQKFVFFAFPHIGISEKGVLGEVDRPGHEHPSSACGAIKQFWKELASNSLHLETDPSDIEYSLLKQRLLKRIPLFSNQVPSVKQLTFFSYDTILEDLEKLISQVVNPAKADYAVLTGIQVHSPGGASYVWGGTQYTVINGIKTELVL
eukprot:Phypoly_transcript_11930.p1 GENE.Phypoly_transcript_11930~~Phypoly_transcript_11930.p1  ORF type:complete len:334 (+),score=73.14 Phypoly_transcript_11930:115-1116(+)